MGVVESVRPPRDNAPSSVIATMIIIPLGVIKRGTGQTHWRLRVGGPQLRQRRAQAIP